MFCPRFLVRIYVNNLANEGSWRILNTSDFYDTREYFSEKFL